MAGLVICKLNNTLGSARYHVENEFGILKTRFQIFNRPMECAEENIHLAIALKSAAFILHNFLIDVKDDLNDEFESNNAQTFHDIQDDDERQYNEATSTREILIKHIRYLMSSYD